MSDTTWFEELYKDSYWKLLRYARSLGGQEFSNLDFEQCVQEAFVVLWAKRAELMRHPNIDGWLRVAVRNKLHDHARYLRRHAAMDMEGLLTHGVVAVELPGADELAIRILDIVGEKTYGMLMAYYAPRSDPLSLAQAYGISRDALKMRVARAVCKIRRRI